MSENGPRTASHHTVIVGFKREAERACLKCDNLLIGAGGSKFLFKPFNNLMKKKSPPTNCHADVRKHDRKSRIHNYYINLLKKRALRNFPKALVNI
ncbi:MAG: hypothetical protein EA412_05010 [Chitinophagaceae bacterium]|nr:MAG: hypothetical protein EA412_05010 [Chitinophagaceae bacterium]